METGIRYLDQGVTLLDCAVAALVLIYLCKAILAYYDGMAFAATDCVLIVIAVCYIVITLVVSANHERLQ